MNKIINNEVEKFKNSIEGNIVLTCEGSYDELDRESTFFLIKLYDRVTDNLRAPWCAIGDKTIDFGGELSLKECLQGSFLFYDEAIGILNKSIKEALNELLKETPQAVILPRIDQHHLINSKIQYLKILQEKRLISNDSQLLFPIDEEGKWINFKNEKHYQKLTEYLTLLKKNQGDPEYRTKSMKEKKKAFTDKKCVLKLPYAGSSDCVLYPEGVTYEDYQGDYLYWLAVYLHMKGNHEKIHHLGCLGFTQGIIIDRYNPYIPLLGEFRCFVANGDIIAISYSSINTGGGFGSIKSLLLKSSIKDKSDTEGYFIYEKTLELVKEAFTKSASIRKYWDSHKTDTENLMDLLVNPMGMMSRELNELLQLNCNRYDFVVNHETAVPGNGFKIMVNEVEDITYGEASYIQFGNVDKINLRFQHLKYYQEKFPGKIDELKKIQGNLSMDILSESDPFEGMNVESLLKSYENALSSGNLTSNRRKVRSSKRSSKRSSRRSSSEQSF